MFFTVMMFIMGFVLGIGSFYLIKENEKELEVKRTMSQLRDEFNEYFTEVESNTHIVCPTCGELMNLDKKLVVVETGEVIDLIYTCPHCSTQQWV